MENQNKYMDNNQNMIEQLDEYMPPRELLDGLVNLFGSLADETRIKIISALAVKNMCVNDIAQSLGEKQSTISHQLKVLKYMGIVKVKKRGKNREYEIEGRVNKVMMRGIEYLGY